MAVKKTTSTSRAAAKIANAIKAEPAKAAKTAAKAVKEEEKTALLDITLHTGRHHQIRVQLAHLGTPICGDHKYGNAAGGMPELCSYHIDFIHPVSGKTMTYDIKPRNFGIAF